MNAADDGWIEWSSGECPVDTNTVVQVRLYDGSTNTRKAGSFHWSRKGGYWNIIAYRIVSPTQQLDTKLTNPKDAVGTRKLPFSVLPWRVLVNVALAMLEGALKYGRHNYRAAGVRASVYFDAVVARHLTSWWEGEDVDPDSGLSHIDKAIAGLMVMRDSMLEGNFVDDRPPRGNVDMTAANTQAAALIERYAGVQPKHYTAEDAS